MATLIIRAKNGAERRVEIVDFAEWSEALGSVGKKELVSIDGGATFVAKHKLKHVDINAFLAGEPTTLVKDGGEPLRPVVPAPSAVASQPAAGQREAQKSRALPTSLDPQAGATLAADQIEARLGGVLQQSVDKLGISLLAAFSQAYGKLDGFQAELAAQAAQTGEAFGEYQRLDELLRDISADLAHRLAPETLGASIRSAIDDATRPVLEQVQQELKQLEARQKHVNDEQEYLDDLIKENKALIGRYKPGEIDYLRQSLEEAGAERERLLQQISALRNAVDDAERKNRQLMASDDEVAERAEIDRKLRQLAKQRDELENILVLQVERDSLRQRVHDLEEVRAQYEANQQVVENNRIAEAELRDLRQAHDSLNHRYEKMKDKAQGYETKSQRLENERAQLLQQLTEKEARFDEFSGELEDFRARDTQMKADQSAHLEKVRQLDEERRAFEKEMAQRAEQLELHNREVLSAEKAQLEIALDEQLRCEFAQQLNGLETENRRLANFEEQFHEVARSYQDAIREKAQWEQERSRREQKIVQLNDEIERLEERVDALEDELRALHARRQEIIDDTSALEGLKSQVQGEWEIISQRDEEAREKLAQEYEAYHARLQAEYDERREALDISRERRIAPIHAGSIELVSRRLAQGKDAELAWLNGVIEQIEAADYYFPRRLIEAFHTSLKIATWAPLTVLAGVSGTGKSELPRLYSMFGGLNHKMISVQPNWDSPQDLFGFYNYMDNSYKATELLQAMVQSQKQLEEGGFNDQLLLVLLDEMNLARVELYFSEFLSKLEARRGLGGDELPYIGVDIGSGEREERVYLGENVLFVGTMNEDETTQTLSDKVLDRGNVITFPRPRQLRSRDTLQQLEAIDRRLPLSTWQSWQVAPESLGGEVRQKVGELLNGINENLAHVNRAVGHRVLQAIENYVANHPRVRAMDKTSDDPWKRALEDQVVQKIMPKLRGIETETERGRACLDGVKRLLEEHTLGIVDDFQRARESGYGAFIWSSANYLTEGE